LCLGHSGGPSCSKSSICHCARAAHREGFHHFPITRLKACNDGTDRADVRVRGFPICFRYVSCILSRPIWMPPTHLPTAHVQSAFLRKTLPVPRSRHPSAMLLPPAGANSSVGGLPDPARAHRASHGRHLTCLLRPLVADGYGWGELQHN
jgi:hypothetical protein